MKHTLTITQENYEALKLHLLPPDGKEAVAIVICGRQKGIGQIKLLVHDLILIPYDQCNIRESHLVNWSTNLLIENLPRIVKKNFAILKIHSHPTGYNTFSSIDDASDRELFQSIFGWMETDDIHASAVMLPTGKIFGRVFYDDLTHTPIDKITIIGDDIIHYFHEEKSGVEDFEVRTAQAFGEGTTNKLRQLKIGVVGCSGTGSPLIEQLVRLGVGELVLVDPDKIEKKNLNRIVNSTMQDAISGVYKVDAIKTAIDRIGLGTKVYALKNNLYDGFKIVNELASCDIVFGCVDSVDGRHLLNQIATFYLIPYFDLGVKLTSDGKGGIDQIMGTVHYLQPGKSSLRTRGVYNDEDLRAASMYRSNYAFYMEQKKSGYIVDINVNSPAVISINTQISSIAINEFLARIHPFRYEPNGEFATNRISLTDSYMQSEKEGETDMYLKKFIGRGDMLPLLNMPELN